MWIDRNFSSTIQRLKKSFPALLVTGPRQVGKTSLLKRLFPEANYFSFDLPSLAKQAEENTQAFLSSFQGPVILDEIQYVPSLWRYLKVEIDKQKKVSQYFLTGSQSFSLMQGVSESLAGRCGILEMHSLSFEEVRKAFPDFSDADYLVRGGYPELYSGSLTHSSDWYSSYLAAYLERDVRNIKNVGSLRDFERLLRACAIRSGQLLSYSELAKDVGVSPNTAKEWISVLTASGQIFLLEPYHRSLGKRLIKSPKIYFMDTGLACYLTGIENWNDLLQSALSGALWENHVIGQIIRFFHEQGKRPPLWFWRTSYGEEVDLLIEKGGRFIGVECKLTENPTNESLKGFHALKEFYGDKVLAKSFVACRTAHSFPFQGKEAWAISGSLLSQELVGSS